jgi:hypothetical protein
MPEMATRAVNLPDDESTAQMPPKIPRCSICDGTMVLAYDRYRQKMCVCLDCHTSMTIPGSAWDVAARKRASRERGATDRRQSCRRAGDIRLQSQ